MLIVIELPSCPALHANWKCITRKDLTRTHGVVITSRSRSCVQSTGRIRTGPSPPNTRIFGRTSCIFPESSPGSARGDPRGSATKPRGSRGAGRGGAAPQRARRAAHARAASGRRPPAGQGREAGGGREGVRGAASHGGGGACGRGLGGEWGRPWRARRPWWWRSRSRSRPRLLLLLRPRAWRGRPASRARLARATPPARAALT